MPLIVRTSYFLCLFSLLALLVIYSIQSLFIELNLTLWLASCLPLLLFVPFLIKKSLRAYQWLGFVVLVYFVAAVLSAIGPDQQTTGIFSVFFCVILFMSAIVFVNQSRKFQLKS